MLEKLERSLGAPDFQVPEVAGYDAGLSHVLPWWRLAEVVLCRGRLMLEEGRLDEAVDACRSLIRLGHRIELAQGVLIHFLVGNAIKWMGIAQGIRLVQEADLGPDELARLEDVLVECSDADDALRDAYRAEYVMLAHTLDDLASGELSAEEAGFPEAGEYILRRSFFLRPNVTKRLAGEDFRRLIDSVSKTKAETGPPDYERRYGGKGLFTWLRPNLAGRMILLLVLPSIESGSDMLRREKFQISALRTLLALKSYHRERGRFPASLEDLVPEHLDEIPIDPFDGKPLRYSAEKRLLYSVGEDLADAGGSPDGTVGQALGDLQEPTLRIELRDR